jgi:hypothetical protein
MTAKCIFLQCVVRSGTKYLGSCLSHHPDIGVFGEIFFPNIKKENFSKFSWFYWYVEQLKQNDEFVFPAAQARIFPQFLDSLRDQHPGKPIFLDLKLEQLNAGTFMLGGVIYRPNHHFIILRRKNLLKLVISSIIMSRRIADGDRLVHRDYVPEKMVVHLDPAYVIRQIRRKSQMVEDYARRVAGSGAPYLEIEYEAFLDERRDAQLDRIQEFIGVEPRKLESDFVKQNPFQISDLVENYSEIADALHKEELGYLLDLPS